MHLHPSGLGLGNMYGRRGEYWMEWEGGRRGVIAEKWGRPPPPPARRREKVSRDRVKDGMG